MDATYLKVRRGGRIVSVAVILAVGVNIAVGVNNDGRREVLSMEIGTSEAEPIWTGSMKASKPLYRAYRRDAGSKDTVVSLPPGIRPFRHLPQTHRHPNCRHKSRSTAHASAASQSNLSFATYCCRTG